MKNNNLCKLLKTRVLVLTDISSLESGVNEPDDTQSLIRLLLYSNHFDIEGLIATHTEKNILNPDYIKYIINKYGEIRSNLSLHDSSFPDEASLLSCVSYGAKADSSYLPDAQYDSPGAALIIKAVDNIDNRPLWITIWGGATDLAQALWKVKSERSTREFNDFCGKIRVYSIADQYDKAGPWIRENCPDVFYITNYMAFRGMYRRGDESLSSSKWVNEHICRRHGALGSAYPDYNGGDPWGEIRGMKEGDTPSFLYLIPNGLGLLESPSAGSWGGRFIESPQNPNHFFDAKDNLSDIKDVFDIDEASVDKYRMMSTVYRWRQEYQNSFQARMDWCINSFHKANHEPVIVTDASDVITAIPGDILTISAKDSYDPDDDNLSFHWWFYDEAGNTTINIESKYSFSNKVTIHIPIDASEGEAHLILSLTDDGIPALTSHKRLILQIRRERTRKS